MLKKARQGKHGGHPTILSRWHACDEYRKSKHIYSSQSTNKTAKMATMWRQRRMTTPLTRKLVGGSADSRRETCRHLGQDCGPTCKKLRHRRQRGTKPSGRRAIGILSILQSLTTGEYFSELGQVSVALRKNPPANRRRVWTVHPQIQHVQSCTAWPHFITRTRVAQGSSLRIAHLCVPKTLVIHVSCLSPCRTWHWLQAQVLSHPFHPRLLPLQRSLPHKQALWFSTHMYPAMIHSRVADQHKSHLSQIRQASSPRQSEKLAASCWSCTFSSWFALWSLIVLSSFLSSWWLLCSCTDSTSPYARMRTFFSLRATLRTTQSTHLHRPQVLERCFVCFSKSLPTRDHATPGCSWVLCGLSSLYFVNYDTDTSDWNQTRPLHNSTLGWTVMPSGQSDSKHSYEPKF